MSLWSKVFNGGTGPFAGPQLGNAPPGAAHLGTPSGGGSTPAQGGGGGSLDPNTRAGNVAAGVPYQLVPAYPPWLRIANDPSIVYFPRLRTATFNAAGSAAGLDQTLTMIVSVPTIVLARTAAAITTTSAALPVGRASLDTFTAQVFRSGSSSDLVDAGWGGQNPAVMALGSTLFGTAAQPMLVPGNGLFVDTGGLLSCRIVTLIDAIRVDVTFWCIEEYGPGR